MTHKQTIYDANGKPVAWISVGAEHTVHCVNAEWERTKEQDKSPKIGNVDEAISKLRAAGLDAWDQIDDPQAYLDDLRHGD